MSKNLVGQYAPSPHSPIVQRMTEAEHNWQIPKFFGNRPSALAAEVFGETIVLVIY